MMQKAIVFLACLFTFCQSVYGQDADNISNKFPKQYFAVQGGLTLLETPVIFYPNIGLSYSKTIYGAANHQLAINPQFQFITIPDVEQKYLLGANAEYKYQTRWGLETNVYVGVNYQLRRNTYDRFEFDNGSLVNIGKNRHQFGPSVGFHLGYKVFKRERFSISPYFGFNLSKLNKSYAKSFTEGFVPTALFGIKLSI